jgi:gliding motility-associated-like protein
MKVLLGEDQFTYTLCDDGNPILCDNATVYITILPDPVIAVDDYEFVSNTDPLNISVLPNDTFTTGTPSVVVITDPLFGSLVDNGDGTFVYYPGNDVSALVDSFQYVLCVNTICDTAWVYIEFSISLDIPDGISPDGDGVNDAFVIKDLLNFYPNATVVMYNRWGDEVWNSYGPYQNNWNGVNFQNVDLPDGTYFYILDFKSSEREPKQGFVAVYRSK